MDITQFQKAARSTDLFSNDPEKVVHHLLNLTESVTVLNMVVEQEFRGKDLPTEYSHRRLTQKLGDILWYVSTIASRNGIDMSHIAEDTLARSRRRWGSRKKWRGAHFDDHYPVYERLPRQLQFVLFDPSPLDKVRHILFFHPIGKRNWSLIGDSVDDNASKEDGYRYHDIFHLAHMAFLGWSPVMRRILKRKRKSEPEIDRIQDGARAGAIEEAITAFVFSHAKEVDFFKEKSSIDFAVLKTIERLSQGLEVVDRSYDDWEDAILHGYAAYRQLSEMGGGVIQVRTLAKDKNKRLTVSPITPELRRELQASDRKVRPERCEAACYEI